MSDFPLATHIGIKGKSGKIEYMHNNYVWCECLYSDEINYQKEAEKAGINKKGILIKKNAYLKKIPINGFYRYKTSPNMYGDWIISGKILVKRILSDTEVNSILKKNNLPVMKRQNNNIVDLASYQK